jgi:hypothetical protein
MFSSDGEYSEALPPTEANEEEGGSALAVCDLTMEDSSATCAERLTRVDSVLAIRDERARYIGEVSHSAAEAPLGACTGTIGTAIVVRAPKML